MSSAGHALTRRSVTASLLTRTPRKKRNSRRLALNELRRSDTELPEVLLETDGLLAVQKPHGYAIQGDHRRANSSKWTDFVKMLQSEYGKLYAVDRLDASTSGAYLFARNKNQSQRLTELLEAGRVPKTFLAVVYGSLEERKQWLDAPEVMLSDSSMGKRLTGWFRVDENETRKSGREVLGAREFVNDVAIIQSSPDGRFHLLRIEPRTSIKHGIRAQLALQLKTPIVGDYKYGELAQHATFNWLKYEGSFALALHCLDITVSTYVNVDRRDRVKVVEGIYAEPSELFAETLRKVSIKALDDGFVRYGGPRGRWRAESQEAPVAHLSAPIANTQSRALVPRESRSQLALLDPAERDRLRRTFDPSRRAREAFDTSLVPSAPPTSVLIAPRPHQAKLSNELEAVRQKRLAASRLTGMIELRRRRRAVKVAKEQGRDPKKLSRPSAAAVRRRARPGMSTEYKAQRVAMSPKAVRRRQADIGRTRLASISRAMPRTYA